MKRLFLLRYLGVKGMEIGVPRLNKRRWAVPVLLVCLLLMVGFMAARVVTGRLEFGLISLLIQILGTAYLFYLQKNGRRYVLGKGYKPNKGKAAEIDYSAR